MKTFILLAGMPILTLLVSTSDVAAQQVQRSTQETQLTAEDLQLLEKKAQGTYQILVRGRQNPLIPQNIGQIVERNRHASKVVYVSLGTMVKVKILPKSEIEGAGFKPVSNVANLSEQEFDKAE